MRYFKTGIQRGMISMKMISVAKKFWIIMALINVLYMIGVAVLCNNSAKKVVMDCEGWGKAVGLTENEKVIQTFFPLSASMEAVELIWSGRLDTGKAAKVELSVYDNANGTVFLNKIVEVSNSNLKKKNRYDFEHAVIDTYGKEYYISIVPVSIPADAELGLMITEKGYKDNHLLFRGKEQEYDIYLSVFTDTDDNLSYFACFLICIDILLVLAFVVSNCLETKTIRKQNVVINIMKVCAAVAVFLCHWGDWISVTGVLDSLTSPGVAGTNIFFVITGFTIWQSIDRKVDWKKYFIKRLFRIVPLYYSIILILYFFTKYGNWPLPTDTSGLGWARYFLFLSTSVPSEQDCWVNLCATWSVSSFMAFYLLAPILKKVIGSFQSSLIAMIVSYLFCNGLLAGWLDGATGINGIFPLLYLWIFLLGVSAYYAVKEDRVLDMCFVVGIILLFKIFGSGAVSGRLESSIMCVLILVTRFAAGMSETKVDKIFYILGKYTYSLYLSHPMVWYISTFYRGVFTGNFSYTVFLVFTIGCTTYIMHNLIELPSNKACQWICGKI